MLDRFVNWLFRVYADDGTLYWGKLLFVALVVFLIVIFV